MTAPGPFSAMYEQECDRLLVFLTRRTFDVVLAGELVAETFALAFEAWARLESRSEEEIRAWLFTVARRLLSRYYRRARAERRAVTRLGIRVPMVHEDDVARIEARAGLGELRVALARELATLSSEQRAALQLRVVDDRPYPEVARLLGVSEAAARARVSRGLRALAAALNVHRPESEVAG